MLKSGKTLKINLKNILVKNQVVNEEKKIMNLR